jgi:lipopolysaccharide export system protein LptC
MNARMREQLAAALSVLLLAALGLFTLHLAQRAARDRDRPPPTPPAAGEPDYFVERLAMLTMRADGAPAYRLQARSYVHFPADDSANFEAPIVVSLDPERPRVTITALKGRLLNQASRTDQEIQLSGEVTVVRAARDDTPQLNALTDYAVVLPDADLVRTDRPVRVTQGGHRIDAVGMELDNRARRLRLDSKVRATLAPPAP